MPLPTEARPILVSVVIVSYNGREYLHDLLAPAVDWDYPQEQ
jgi:hypothetical protein